MSTKIHVSGTDIMKACDYLYVNNLYFCIVSVIPSFSPSLLDHVTGGIRVKYQVTIK